MEHGQTALHSIGMYSLSRRGLLGSPLQLISGAKRKSRWASILASLMDNENTDTAPWYA